MRSLNAEPRHYMTGFANEWATEAEPGPCR